MELTVSTVSIERSPAPRRFLQSRIVRSLADVTIRKIWWTMNPSASNPHEHIHRIPNEPTLMNRFRKARDEVPHHARAPSSSCLPRVHSETELSSEEAVSKPYTDCSDDSRCSETRREWSRGYEPLDNSVPTKSIRLKGGAGLFVL